MAPLESARVVDFTRDFVQAVSEQKVMFTKTVSMSRHKRSKHSGVLRGRGAHVSFCANFLLLVMPVTLAFAELSEPPAHPPFFPTTYVVEVEIDHASEVDLLFQQGFNVGNLRGLTATLYVSPADYLRLTALGYPSRMVGIEPETGFSDKQVGYHTPEDIATVFSSYAAAYPDLCRVYQIGTSVQGRPLWVIKITADAGVHADKPAVKFISTMHGNEPVGTEMCMYFIQELLFGYGNNPYITDLLERTVLWILPMMNPDGFVSRSRNNAQGIDLNRAFPVYPRDFTRTLFDGDPLGADGRAVEAAHVMRWSASTSFALAANFHTGALVVNYPYDNDVNIPSGQEAPSPDDALFRHVSLQYSTHNLPMYNNPEFPQGIVNGSAWYSILGGMQDWNYRFLGCPEVTIELSNVKWPALSALPGLWENNRLSMYAYVEMAHIGIRGVVRHRNSGMPVVAKVLVSDNPQPVFSSPEYGNYHRLLLPGVYTVHTSAPGFIAYHHEGVHVLEGPATRADVPLSDGDINADGHVNLADVQLAVDAALGRAVTQDADVDGRGLSATDIQAVINQKPQS